MYFRKSSLSLNDQSAGAYSAFLAKMAAISKLSIRIFRILKLWLPTMGKEILPLITLD